jgi:hypothetical protein
MSDWILEPTTHVELPGNVANPPTGIHVASALDTRYMLKQVQAQADCLQRRLEFEPTDH